MGPIHPPAQISGSPLSVVDQFEAQAIDQAAAGNVIAAIETLDQLNSWLTDSGQVEAYGKDPAAMLLPALKLEAERLVGANRTSEAISLMESARVISPTLNITVILKVEEQQE